MPGAPYGSGNQGGNGGGGGSDNESDQVKSLMELQQQGGIPGYGPYRKDIRSTAVLDCFIYSSSKKLIYSKTNKKSFVTRKKITVYLLIAITASVFNVKKNLHLQNLRKNSNCTL